MKKYTTRQWSEMAIITAMYVALTFVLPMVAFGIINFRVSEILMVLPFLNHKYSYSVILGCFIVNLFSPMGIPDMIFGTLATAIVCLLLVKINNFWLIPIIATVVNGVIIGIELNLVLKQPLFIAMGSVALGEFIIMMIGTIVFYFAIKNKRFKQLITE